MLTLTLYTLALSSMLEIHILAATLASSVVEADFGIQNQFGEANVRRLYIRFFFRIKFWGPFPKPKLAKN